MSLAVRSIRCPQCRAGAGIPCGPAGDHLARWIAAWGYGLLPHSSLTVAVAAMYVIGAHAPVPEPAA